MERKAIAVAAALGALLALLIGLTAPSPAAAQGPAALTPSPEPPTPTASVAPTPSAVPSSPVPPSPVPPSPVPGTPLPTREPEPDPGVPDLVISKSGGSAAQPGDLLTFTITVANIGDGAANDVVVTDELPGMLSVYNATTTRGVIAVSGQSLSVEIGRMEPGEEVSITVVAQVNGAAQPGGYTNTASVVTSSPEQNTGNNTAQASFNVVMQPTALPASPTAAPASPTAAPASPTALPPTTLPPTAATPAPTAAPRPVPMPPAVLPDAGAQVRNALGLLLPLALGALVLGLVLRRRVRR